jgi:formyltetrahydrofolate-dependent phosphoribosylglycinamide formyltransferase
MTKLRLAILISGRGSNMEAILRATQDADYPVQPILVLSNKPNAQGLEIAKTYSVETLTVDHRTFGKEREAFEREMHAALTNAHTDLIALAGFMRVLTPWFVREWSGRMVNIHPSLLPKYTGLNTHQRAIRAGDTHTGCSVHWVTEDVDEGGVIAQDRIEITPTDTAETLAQRLLPVEHSLYPRALAIAANQVKPRVYAAQNC